MDWVEVATPYVPANLAIFVKILDKSCEWAQL